MPTISRFGCDEQRLGTEKSLSVNYRVSQTRGQHGSHDGNRACMDGVAGPILHWRKVTRNGVGGLLLALVGTVIVAVQNKVT